MLYKNIAEQIKQQIDRGVLIPHDRLPSVRRLKKEKQVSLTTVQNAYGLLIEQDIVYARQGAGYFVSPTTKETASASACIISPKLNNKPVILNNSQLIADITRRANDKKLIPLGVSLPDESMFPLQQLQRILNKSARGSISKDLAEYPLGKGLYFLRRQLARYYNLQGVNNASADDFLITYGAHEALYLSLSAVTQKGDVVAVQSPNYHGLFEIINALGLKALEIPCDSRYGVEPDDLRSAIKQWSIKACILAPNFANPLGCTMPDENKKKIVKLMARHRIPLIEDDTMGDLGYLSYRPKPLKAFDVSGIVMTCSSTTKTLYSGFRVGWVMAGGAMEKMMSLKYAANISCSLMEQKVIAGYLASGHYAGHREKVSRIYQQNQINVLKAIDNYFPSGTETTKPEGGLVVWVKLPRGVAALDVYEQALRYKISIVPGNILSGQSKYKQFIRINYSCRWSEEVENALRVLGGIIGQFA